MKTKKFLVNLIFLLSFFPFIRFLPILSQFEVQPYAGIIALILIFLYNHKKDASNIIAFWLMVVVIVYSVISIGRGIDGAIVIAGVISYILPITIFICLKDNIDLLSSHVVVFSIVAYFVVGLLQVFSLLVWAEPFMQIIIGRFSGGVSGGGRGVSLLAPEPSYSASIIFMMFSAVFILSNVKRISKSKTILLSVLIILMTLFNLSATVMVYFAVFFVVWLACGIKNKKIFLVFVAMSAIAVIISINVQLIDYFYSFRFGYFARYIIDHWDALFSLRTMAAVGGKRIFTVMTGYLSLKESILGHGISSYAIDIYRIAQQNGLDMAQYKSLMNLGEMNAFLQSSIKPDSYASQLAMDTGIIGLGLLSMLLVVVYKTKKKIEKRISRFSISVMAVLIYILYFQGTTSLPAPWVLLAFVYYMRRNNEAKTT